MDTNKLVEELVDQGRKNQQIMIKQMFLMEKLLVTVNSMVPKGSRMLSISDREVKARELLGLNLFGYLNPKEIKHQFKIAAKKCHPDVNEGQTTDEFLKLQEAMNYLLQLEEES